MRIFITSFFLLYAVTVYSFSREEVLNYIDLYKLIAVEEMQDNGIPASIKMAQAILESNAGTSDLALEANNHFGIKCGGIWEGPTYFKKDDDRDRRGRLIPSCFRVFTDAEDSFRAHSLFLRDPKKAYRYGPLFSLEKTDYKSWAWGLTKAGYATNPAYANLLIHLIEKYSLYTFDYYEDSNVKFVKPSDLIAQSRTVNYSKKLDGKSQNTIVSRPGEPVTRSSAEQRIEINNLEALKVREGQTMEQLAQKYEVSPKQILKFNENQLALNEYLDDNMYVYLEKKRIWYHGSDTYHIVREGEDLYRISQLYGIRVSTLERKNKIDADMIPLPGQKIILKGRSVRGDEIPLTYDDVDIIESNEVSEPVLAEPGSSHRISTGSTKTDLGDRLEVMNQPLTDGETQSLSEKEMGNQTVPVFDLQKEAVAVPEPVAPAAIQNPVTDYKVIKGDTLYGISRKFGVTVDSIRQKNQLQSDHIRIGQKLKIHK